MKRAAPLFALLLLVPLLPAAEAAGPEPRPWPAYSALSDVAMLALAREGTTIAAALVAAVTPPATPGVGTVPGVPGSGAANLARTDLSILDYESGWVRNGSNVGPPGPLGRSHVAVSRDGTSIATLGLESGTTADPQADTTSGVPANARRVLHFLRVSPGANFSATPAERRVDLGFPSAVSAVGLALSDDGRRLVVLTGEGGDYVLRGYTFGTTLDSAFALRAPGAPRALAASGDLNAIVVAGQFPVGPMNHGGAYLYPFGQHDAVGSYFDSSANNTDVRAAHIARDGETIALRGVDGRVFLFQGGKLSSPVTASLATAGAANSTLSEDGRRLAVANGLTLTHYDVSSGTPVALWNATLTGANVTGLALNRTGALLVVGTSGTGGGVFAFDDASSTPLWSIPGDNRGVAVDSAGTRVAYAQRAAISAARLPRSVVMELAAGGKVAPQRTVALPGSATYEVSLRNDGAAAERVVFEEGAPEISVAPHAPVVIRPGEILRANFTVVVDQPLSGPRVFNVTARSTSSGLVDNVTLAIAPKPTLDVKLLLNDTDVLAEPGKTSTILLTIANNGTSDASVGLRAAQTVSAGPLWDLSISETSLTALRGTRASVKVLMTPPPTVANGTSSTVTFTLEGQDVFDAKRVTFRVNPELEVEVNATGVTKFIEPGKRGHYNVTVTNTGSLPRQFDVFYTILESSGRSWGVDMPTAAVRIDPLGVRTFPVTIIAPADAQPNERVSVLVSARSIPEQVNESAVIDNVTLFGVAVPLKITTTTPTSALPAPPLAAILLVALLPALLLRRRR